MPSGATELVSKKGNAPFVSITFGSILATFSGGAGVTIGRTFELVFALTI